MTDSELAKAVADACGIEVDMVYIKGKLAFCAYSGGGDFDPAYNWSDAMHAADKCGLFSLNSFGLMVFGVEGWTVHRRASGEIIHRTNESGPRAICEAILAVKGVQG